MFRQRMIVVSMAGISALGLAAMGGCNAAFGWSEATLDGGATTSAALVSCESYCSLAVSNCTGTNLEYANTETCKKMCPTLDVGSATSPTGNTVACRQSHAAAAAQDPLTHCKSAGPIGGDCNPDPGQRCQIFCDFVFTLCEKEGAAPYASRAECRAACAGYPYKPEDADYKVETGNSLNCRIYHLQSGFASHEQAVHHCPHAGPPSEALNPNCSPPK